MLIYKNWPHDARLDDKMVEGLASTKDAFLDDNEQLLVDARYYEDAW